QYPEVRTAVVTVCEDVPGVRRLLAYVVPEQGDAPTTTRLRSFLKQRLPDYMVPSAFSVVESLPLTPSGKIDRRALPIADWTAVERNKSYVAPRTPIEDLLVS